MEKGYESLTCFTARRHNKYLTQAEPFRNEPFESYHVQFWDRLHHLHQLFDFRQLGKQEVIVHPQEVLGGDLGDRQVPASKPALMEENMIS